MALLEAKAAELAAAETPRRATLGAGAVAFVRGETIEADREGAERVGAEATNPDEIEIDALEAEQSDHEPEERDSGEPQRKRRKGRASGCTGRWEMLEKSWFPSFLQKWSSRSRWCLAKSSEVWPPMTTELMLMIVSEFMCRCF